MRRWSTLAAEPLALDVSTSLLLASRLAVTAPFAPRPFVELISVTADARVSPLKRI